MFDGFLINKADITTFVKSVYTQNSSRKNSRPLNNSFAVNLLPWRMRKRFKDFKHSLLLIVLFSLSLLVLSLVLIRYQHVLNIKLQGSLTVLQHEKLGLENTLSLVSKQMQSIKHYEQLAKRYQETELMNGQLLTSLKRIAEILPENSWLTHLGYQNSTWQFSGMSYLAEEIELFIAELRKHEQFSEIALERVIQQLPKPNEARSNETKLNESGLNKAEALPRFLFSFRKPNKPAHRAE